MFGKLYICKVNLNNKRMYYSKLRSYTLLWVLTFSTFIFASTKNIEISSPDKKVKLDIALSKDLTYAVRMDDVVLLKDCKLNLQIGTKELVTNPVLKQTRKSVIHEKVDRLFPIKDAVIMNNCNVLTLEMKGGYSIEFRVFNDAVAYRFITQFKGKVDVMNENFTIGFPEDYIAHLSETTSFKTSCEVPYSHRHTNEFGPKDKMTYLPVLIQTNQQYKILISETDLADYPCMFLKGTDNNGLTSVFPHSPLAFDEDGDRSMKITQEASYIARTQGTRTYPWRYFLISRKDTEILENELTYLLASPNELTDVSWIKPGQVSWDWWNHRRLWGVDFKAGVNTDTYKYYIDFASKHGVAYIILDEGWAKSTRNPFETIPEVDLPEIIRYGKTKNVGIILWLPWLTAENNMDLFKKYAEWGVAGVKIDFMDRSDQWMVNYYERIVKEAAKYHLLVDFHGAFKPAGLERRYPNLISYEGVLGLEQNDHCKPENSVWLPFIRNAVGPMDFTPGAMISCQPEDARATGANPMSTGTRAYQMALYVVFESQIQMLSDSPSRYYQDQDCTRFMTSVPTTWDETRYLDAQAGAYVVVAKRKGHKWFLGAIAANKGQDLNVNLDFLPASTMTMTSFEDGVNADSQAMDYKMRKTTVNKHTQLHLHLVRNGGWCAVIE